MHGMLFFSFETGANGYVFIHSYTLVGCTITTSGTGRLTVETEEDEVSLLFFELTILSIELKASEVS